jgi:hypothetical protein
MTVKVGISGLFLACQSLAVCEAWMYGAYFSGVRYDGNAVRA